MPQKLYALLVGINEYHPQSEGVNPLAACLNDVEAMQNLLEKQYADLSPKVKTLLNEDATRQNIIDSFRSHLRDQANENTTVLFYYSGHGGRQSLPKAFQKYVAGYRKEETLVCYDSRARIDGKFIEQDLADKELAILIEEVANKGAHVVIILDCCHSGSGTRSKSKITNIKAQKREVEERAVKDALHRNYLDNYYENQLQEKGGITLPNSTHILLAGTQKEHVSWETYINGQLRGVFSYYLEQVLLENPHLTYAELFSLVHPRVNQFTQDFRIIQNPQFETYHFFDAHSHFLTGAMVSENRRFYSLKMVRSKWRIEYGEIHGLASVETNPKVEWAIYANPADKDPIAFAKTSQVGMDYNVVEIVKGSLDPDKNYLAELRSMPTQQLTIGVNLNPPLVELTSPLFRLTDDNTTNEQLIIDEVKNTYVITQGGNELIAGKYETVNIVSKLDRIAHWHRVLDSCNAQPQLFTYEDFPLTFKVVGEPILVKTVTDIRDTFELNSEEEKYFPAGENAWVIPYEITAQNRSGVDVHFTLLHLDAFYGVEVPFNQPVPANSNEIVLVQGQGLFPEAPLNPTIDRFKLLVSTRELHSYLFTQKDIREVFHQKNKRTDQRVPDDWLTKVLEVHITKK